MFPTLEAAIAISKQYAGIANNNFLWDDSLTALLTASKGIESYRPYIVAAYHLWSASGIARKQLYEGDGAKFLKPEDLKPAVEGLLQTQESLDGQLSGIADSWSVAKVRLLCGCASNNGVGVGGAGFVI